MTIKKIVNNLIRKYQTNDPFLLADELNVKILYENLGCKHAYFSYFYGIPIIHINECTNERYHLFLCAHELGHFVLHENLNFSYFSVSPIYNAGRIEREANEFAVELLLSDDIIQDHPHLAIQTVADMVGIPRTLYKLKKK